MRQVMHDGLVAMNYLYNGKDRRVGFMPTAMKFD